MKLPTDWQYRHVFALLACVAFAMLFIGLYLMNMWLLWGAILLHFANAMAFMNLPEHGDPWSKRNAAGTADGKPDGQAENTLLPHP